MLFFFALGIPLSVASLLMWKAKSCFSNLVFRGLLLVGSDYSPHLSYREDTTLLSRSISVRLDSSKLANRDDEGTFITRTVPDIAVTDDCTCTVSGVAGSPRSCRKCGLAELRAPGRYTGVDSHHSLEKPMPRYWRD